MNSAKNQLPAILGGRPSITLDHQRSNTWPNLSQEDEDAVIKILRDGNISTHPVIRELENDYAEFSGRKYALAHNNGTSALLAAFFAIGLKSGDEVIVPSATFWASVLPMLWLGAVPVFCESEMDRLGPDPVDIERKITTRTKAIVVVHLWGLPCKMSEIFAIARKYNLKIIEDASHVHGALWHKRPCGSLGDISVFSLQGDKLAPAGEGGMFLCDNYKYFERAVCLGDITRIMELETPARRFAATSFGIKTRIAPVSAAIGRNQLKNLKRNNRIRNQNIDKLSKGIMEFGFHTFSAPNHIERVYFEFIIYFDSNKHLLEIEQFVLALKKEGCVINCPRYPLLHQQPFFKENQFLEFSNFFNQENTPTYKEVSLPFTERINNNLLRLPSFPGADDGIIEQYINAFTKIYYHEEEIFSYFQPVET